MADGTDLLADDVQDLTQVLTNFSYYLEFQRFYGIACAKETGFPTRIQRENSSFD